MTKDWRPRLSIEVTEQQMTDLQELIPWGNKTKIFSAIIDDLISVLKGENGHIAFAAMVCGAVRPKDILPVMSQNDKTEDNNDT